MQTSTNQGKNHRSINPSPAPNSALSNIAAKNQENGHRAIDPLPAPNNALSNIAALYGDDDDDGSFENELEIDVPSQNVSSVLSDASNTEKNVEANANHQAHTSNRGCIGGVVQNTKAKADSTSNVVNGYEFGHTSNRGYTGNMNSNENVAPVPKSAKQLPKLLPMLPILSRKVKSNIPFSTREVARTSTATAIILQNLNRPKE